MSQTKHYPSSNQQRTTTKVSPHSALLFVHSVSCFPVPFISSPVSVPPSLWMRSSSCFPLSLEDGYWQRGKVGRTGRRVAGGGGDAGQCWWGCWGCWGCTSAPWAAGMGGEMATAALEKRMWHMDTWGIPLDFYHSASSTFTGSSWVQQPAPLDATWPSEPGSGEPPSVPSCLHEILDRYNGGYFHHGIHGHLNPVLSSPQSPWGKYNNQLFMEPFTLRRSLPLVKIVWVSDFLLTCIAQSYILSE